MNWAQRMFTLPKAHDRLSTVIPGFATQFVADLVHTHIASAAATALTGALHTGETEVAKVQASIVSAITGVVAKVDPALVPVIQGEVGTVVTGAEHWAEGAIPGVVESLVKLIGAKFGIG